MAIGKTSSMDTTNGPLVLAHRGWSAVFPESTLSAFREALLAGADGLEFDVQLTADDVIVIIHDADISRTTDGNGRIKDLDRARIQSFNAATHWTSLPAEPIPTLQAVLDAAYELKPGGLYNVEIKVHEGDDWTRLVEAVVALVNTHPLKSRILFSSFCHDSLAYLKRIAPDAHIGLLFKGDVPDAWEKAEALDAYSVHVQSETITEDFVTVCHEHGIRVAVWVVDDPAELKRVATAGTDIVITKCVDTALEILRK